MEKSCWLLEGNGLGWVGEIGEIGEGSKRYKLSARKQVSHGYVMYSIGHIVNNIVMPLCGDR